VIDAEAMEAHGSPGAAFAQRGTAHLPDAVTEPLMKKGRTRPGWPRSTRRSRPVGRGGTVSLSGVYGGMADAMPMMSLFDKRIQLRMGQANVKRWIRDVMPFLTDDDPLAWTNTLLTGCRSPMLRRRTACPAQDRRRSRPCSSRGHDPVVIIQ
jgi:hypothetical protein